jgi:hypothetical protein
MVPLLQRLTFEQRKSKQNALAPSLGTWLRLGVPALRHYEAGTVKCGSWLACDGITSVCLKNRVVCIAGKPAPTEKQSCISFRFGFRSGFCLCF